MVAPLPRKEGKVLNCEFHPSLPIFFITLLTVE